MIESVGRLCPTIAASFRTATVQQSTRPFVLLASERKRKYCHIYNYTITMSSWMWNLVLVLRGECSGATLVVESRWKGGGK